MDSATDFMAVPNLSLEVGSPLFRMIVSGSLEAATGMSASSEVESLNRPNSG